MKKITIIAIILIAMLLASCSPQNETPVIVEEEISTTPTETKPKVYEFNYYGAPFSKHNVETGELEDVIELSTKWLTETDHDSWGFRSLVSVSSDRDFLYVLTRKFEPREDSNYKHTSWMLLVYHYIDDPYFLPETTELDKTDYFYYRQRGYNTATPLLAYEFDISDDFKQMAYSYVTDDDRVVVSWVYKVENAVELDTETLEEKEEYEALNGNFYMVYDPVEEKLVFPEKVFLYEVWGSSVLNPHYLYYSVWNQEGLKENEGWLTKTKMSSLVGFFNNNSRIDQVRTYITVDDDYWRINQYGSYVCSDCQF